MQAVHTWRWPGLLAPTDSSGRHRAAAQEILARRLPAKCHTTPSERGKADADPFARVRQTQHKGGSVVGL
eukprot:4062416-Alexandrium_andersonii.AAC.1